jgi:protein TonB
MNPVPRSLVLSLAGHTAGLALLVWLAIGITPIPAPAPIKIVTVAFALPPPPAPPPPDSAPPPVMPPPVMPPPPPAAVAQIPIVPAPPKAAPKLRPPQIVHEPPSPNLPPAPATPAPAPPPPPQLAAVPRPPAPTISADYRSALGAWLESHKRYPDSARQHGEQGQAVVRFRVDRSGRVLSYTLVSGTGYPDLDSAIEAMMRGAAMPPFPASMPEPEIEVSVTVHFGLTR